jgi:hypothetical protein
MVRLRCASAVGWVALVVAACAGRGEARSGASVSVACDHAFDAWAQRSCGRTLPDDEIARLRPRYGAICANMLALRDESMTASQLDACALALEARPCGAAEVPSACLVTPGPRGAGAACDADGQCASASCAYTIRGDADGGPSISSCGTCAAPLALGAACAEGQGACPSGAACNVTASQPTCTLIVLLGAGAACDDAVHRCASGLVCDAVTRKCTGRPPPRAVLPLAWSAIGATCGEDAPCLVGACGLDGHCPRVLADGAPCEPSDTTATCDTFARCTRGTCRLEYSAPCAP